VSNGIRVNFNLKNISITSEQYSDYYPEVLYKVYSLFARHVLTFIVVTTQKNSCIIICRPPVGRPKWIFDQ